MYFEDEPGDVMGGQGRRVEDVRENAIIAACCIAGVGLVAMASGLCALAWPLIEPLFLALFIGGAS